jgi:serine/threonine protein phosphatase PrpC
MWPLYSRFANQQQLLYGLVSTIKKLLRYTYLLIVLSFLPFAYSLLMTPVLSADNVTDVKANQNLFSDLSRNMTIENSQDNSSSNDNSTGSSDNSTSIPEPGPSSD